MFVIVWWPVFPLQLLVQSTTTLAVKCSWLLLCRRWSSATMGKTPVKGQIPLLFCSDRFHHDHNHSTFDLFKSLRVYSQTLPCPIYDLLHEWNAAWSAKGIRQAVDSEPSVILVEETDGKLRKRLAGNNGSSAGWRPSQADVFNLLVSAAIEFTSLMWCRFCLQQNI